MKKDTDRQRASNETSNAGGTPLDPERICSDRISRHMMAGDAEGLACWCADLPRTPEAIAYVRREDPELFAKVDALVQQYSIRADAVVKKLAVPTGTIPGGDAAASGPEAMVRHPGILARLFRDQGATAPVIGQILGAQANGKTRRPADCMTVGRFTVASGVVFVTDPCDEADGVLTLDGVRGGAWLAHVLRVRPDGRRVAELTCHAEGTTVRPDGWDWRLELAVHVETGQAGVFDAARYHDNSSIPGLAPAGGSPVWGPWYSACCRLTRDMAGVIPFGAVSSTGCGDGCYPCYTQTDGDGLVTAISIVFLDESGED